MCVNGAIISAHYGCCQINSRCIFVLFAQFKKIIILIRNNNHLFSPVFYFFTLGYGGVFCANCKKITGYNLVTIVTGLFFFVKPKEKHKFFINKKEI